MKVPLGIEEQKAVLWGYFIVLTVTYAFTLSFPGVYAGQLADGSNTNTPAVLQAPWAKPDLSLFYLFLYLLGIFGALQRYVKVNRFFRTPLHLFGVWKTNVGEILVISMVICLNLFYFIYYINSAAYDGADAGERYAKTVGHLNDLWFALVFLPNSKHGIWETILNRSFDENMKFHRWAGYGAFFWVSVHFTIWNVKRLVEGDWVYKFWTEGMDLQFSKAAADLGRPCEVWEVVLAQCGDGHNVYIPPLYVLFWVFLASVVSSLYRRSNYDVFYILHWVFAPIVLLAIFHSWHLWQLIFPGAMLWLYNRWVSRARACTVLHVNRPQTHVSPGVTHLSLQRKDGMLINHSAGQFVYLNVPEIDPYSWHPFTIASAPRDVTGSYVPTWSHHIRNMGPDQWTGKLHALVSSGQEFNVRFDGPFGTPPRYLEQAERDPGLQTVVFVVGGIGCTPMMALVDEFHALVKQHGIEGLNGITQVHVLWSVRTPEFCEMYKDTILALQASSPNHFKFALHCSRSTRKDQRLANDSDEKVDTIDTSPLLDLETSVNDVTELVTPLSDLEIISTRADVHQYLLDACTAGSGKTAVFACGPPAMVEDAYKTCGELRQNGQEVIFDDTVFAF